MSWGKSWQVNIFAEFSLQTVTLSPVSPSHTAQSHLFSFSPVPTRHVHSNPSTLWHGIVHTQDPCSWVTRKHLIMFSVSLGTCTWPHSWLFSSPCDPCAAGWAHLLGFPLSYPPEHNKHTRALSSRFICDLMQRTKYCTHHHPPWRLEPLPLPPHPCYWRESDIGTAHFLMTGRQVLLCGSSEGSFLGNGS